MIAILDYGSGNLRSAQKAFASTGEDVVITSDFKICSAAAGLVVPGVGAFQSCMRGLKAVDGDEIIRERLTHGRPTLGICVGMQILFAGGTEGLTQANSSNLQSGVGVWPGTIEKLSAPVLPHMGWNDVSPPLESKLFRGIEKESFYFVHSFAAKNSTVGQVSWSQYGEPFVAALEDASITATQFHPEKSGRAGLTLIENWISML